MAAQAIQLAAVVWAIGVAVCESRAASITAVGVLSEVNAFSEVRAMSPDGRYAVGGSMNTEGVVTPYVWTAAEGIQRLPSPRGGNGWATGVDVRPAVGQIVIAGQIGGVGYRYNAPLIAGTLGAGTWSRLTGDPTVSDYNALTTFSNGDKYYIAGYLPGSCTSKDRGYRYRGSSTQNDFWSNASKWETRLTCVAANGRTCGFDSSGAAVWTAPPAAYEAVPSAGDWESAFVRGISHDGRWVTGGFATGGKLQAFKWEVQGEAVIPLATIVGDAHAVGMDCSDAGTAVGTSLGSDGLGRATVWDSTGLWGYADAPVPIADRLATAGLDMSPWVGLTQANSISRDGLTIAGEGVWAADGSTRGWVATIPEPVGWMLLLPAVVWAVRAGREGGRGQMA